MSYDSIILAATTPAALHTFLLLVGGLLLFLLLLMLSQQHCPGPGCHRRAPLVDRTSRRPLATLAAAEGGWQRDVHHVSWMFTGRDRSWLVGTERIGVIDVWNCGGAWSQVAVVYYWRQLYFYICHNPLFIPANEKTFLIFAAQLRTIDDSFLLRAYWRRPFSLTLHTNMTSG